MSGKMKKSTKTTTGRAATKAERDKIVSLIRQRKVCILPINKEAMEGISRGLREKSGPDFTLTHVVLDATWQKSRKVIKGETFGDDGGFDIGWGTKSAGFGHISFYRKNGKLYCDSERSSRKWVKEVLAKLVDEAIFTED